MVMLLLGSLLLHRLRITGRHRRRMHHVLVLRGLQVVTAPRSREVPVVVHRVGHVYCLRIALACRIVPLG